MRPQKEDYLRLGKHIMSKIGKAAFVLMPTDHGAYSDSLHLREPFSDLGLNAVYYERGPYTKIGRLIEFLYQMPARWADRLVTVDLQPGISHSSLESDHCIDQTNIRVHGARIMLTPPREPVAFIRKKGNIDYVVMFEDEVGSDNASSGKGAFLYGFRVAKAAGLKGFYLAASRDYSGGLAHFAAVRGDDNGLVYQNPDSWMSRRDAGFLGYLVSLGYKPVYNGEKPAILSSARPKGIDLEPADTDHECRFVKSILA